MMFPPTCLPLGIFPNASNLARACLRFSILLYCFAFTYNGSSSENSGVLTVVTPAVPFGMT